jgi:uncharacterized protein YwqG
VSIALYLVLAFALALVVLYLRRPHLFTDLRDELRAAVDDAKAEMAARKNSAEPAAGEPISDDEADEIIGWYRAQTRPALLLEPNAEANALSAPARLGGKVWFAEGEEWPRGPDSEPLEFVAHLDFSRLPPLDGFPSEGIARFFVGRDDIWGADLDAPDKSNVRVLWHDGPATGGRLEDPLHWGKDQNSPFESVSLRENGLALRPKPIEDLPDFYSWQLQEELDRYAGRLGQDELENELFEIVETREYAHRIAGYPSFTQYDFRKRGEHDDLDVVLLGLSSDDAIMWGDVGEAAFYIRRSDLERRDFSRVAFYWDCH